MSITTTQKWEKLLSFEMTCNLYSHLCNGFINKLIRHCDWNQDFLAKSCSRTE